MKVFISHSSCDAEKAKEICSVIEQNGHSCFFAPRDIRSGHEYAEEIINGIDDSGTMLLLLSENSNASPHVLREVERAASHKIPIIVYKLEEVQISRSMEYFLMTHQWLNEKADKGYGEIIRSINSFDGIEKNINSTEKSTAAKKPLNVFIIAAAAIALIAGVIAAVAANKDKPDTQPHATGDAAATSEVTSEAAALPTAEFGDRVTLGSYYNEPIEWRIISISEDGTRATAISDKILTMKAFDAAEGGEFNIYNDTDYWGTPLSDIDEELQRLLRGDNRWETSNLRTWLNSERENVVYTDQPPIAKAMAERTNPYHTESGFLNDFSEEELSALLTAQVTTNGSVTEDKVYLLASDELDMLIAADVSIDTTPTEKAVEFDLSNWYDVYVDGYNMTDHIWWLRDAAQGDGFTNACEVMVISTAVTYSEPVPDSAALEGYGVRPVITIDLTSPHITIE